MTAQKSMTLAELWAYLGSEWKWIAMNKEGTVYAFTDKPGRGGAVWVYMEGDYTYIPFKISDMNPDWAKSLVERPVDYSQYAGCLGWFWDESKYNPALGELFSVTNGEDHAYRAHTGTVWQHFRPCTSDEIAVWAAKAKEAGV